MGAGDWTVDTKLNLASSTADTNFHTGLTVKFGPNNHELYRSYGFSQDEEGRSAILLPFDSTLVTTHP
jgi:hypothetical protein